MPKLPGKLKLVLAVVVPGGLLIASALVVPPLLRRHAEKLGEPQVVVPGVLYRSRQPRAPIAERLRRHGIRTVVNVRTVREDPAIFAAEQRACRAAGVRLVHMPMSSVTPTDEQVEQFLQIVHSAPRPVLVHCEHGKARTGMLVAAYRIVTDGWSTERAYEEMLEYRYNSEAPYSPKQMAFLEHVLKNRAQFLAESAAPLPPAGVASVPRR